MRPLVEMSIAAIALAASSGLSVLGQEKASNPKLNSDFLNAILKGDTKKMNALAGKGADVNGPHESTSNVEDVQAVSGGVQYRIVRVAGPAQPMLTAIRSARPEAVQALLTLGAEVKTEFLWGASSGVPMAGLGLIANTINMGFGATVTDASGNTICCTAGPSGTVISRVRPTPARKMTFLGLAEELQRAEQNSGRQGKLQQIVDLLRPATQQ